jgi:hypothetical protein
LGYLVSCIGEASTADDSSSTIADSEVDCYHKKLILDLQPAERGCQGQILEADLVLWIAGSVGLRAAELQLATGGELKTEKAKEASSSELYCLCLLISLHTRCYL